jgi:hypothetical protein
MTFRRLDVSDEPIRKTGMRVSMSQILQAVEDAPTKQDKINTLRHWDCPPLRSLLQACFDPNIKWLLPKGTPQYTPSILTDIESRLFQETKHLYLFVEGGNPNLTNLKRGNLFIQILESITPEDAKLLIGVKDQEMPYQSITAKLVSEAFPGIIPGLGWNPSKKKKEKIVG